MKSVPALVFIQFAEGKLFEHFGQFFIVTHPVNEVSDRFRDQFAGIQDDLIIIRKIKIKSKSADNLVDKAVNGFNGKVIVILEHLVKHEARPFTEGVFSDMREVF
ncbi:hypothetical protein FQZ97_877350 [compost metagenome]